MLRIKRDFLYSDNSRIVYFHFLLYFRRTVGFFAQNVWNIQIFQVCPKQLCKYNLYFTLLNSPGWLNTVTGDETGLTSEVISTTSLRTQPLTGCTTPPGSTPPILFEQQSEFFYVPQESTVFRPYPRRPQASWLPYIHFLAIACILRKRLVHVTGSNIFPDKHLWQILRWR